MNNKDEVSRRSRGYEERIVAFVDILGFSSLVEKSNTDQRVYEQIKHALDTIQEIKKRSDGTNTKAATFSDSIVLSYSITAEKPLLNALKNLVELQFELLRQGILVRGGVAKGPVRHVQEMVFGPAMVAAYELESKYAVYPRIIIEKELIDWETQNYHAVANYSIDYGIDLNLIVRKDGYTDVFYIDTFRYIADTSYAKSNSLYESIKTLIIEGLDNNNKAVRMKYAWLKNYFEEATNQIIGYQEQL